MLVIDEITQSAQNPCQQVKITNVSDIGITIFPQSVIATMELLSAFKNTSPNIKSPDNSVPHSLKQAQEPPSMDVKPASQCLCKIPNKIFVTNPCGNHGISPRWESHQLIQDLTQKDHLHQGGIYTHKSIDPFFNSIYIFCNDKFNFPSLSNTQASEIHSKQNITTTQYNFCFTQPSMYTQDVFKFLLQLSNHAPIQTYQITHLCTQCQPYSVIKRKEEAAIKATAAILLHNLPDDTSKLQDPGQMQIFQYAYHDEIFVPNMRDNVALLPYLKITYPHTPILSHIPFSPDIIKLTRNTHHAPATYKGSLSRKRITLTIEALKREHPKASL